MAKKLTDEEKELKAIAKFSEKTWKQFVAENDSWDANSYVRYLITKLYKAQNGKDL